MKKTSLVLLAALALLLILLLLDKRRDASRHASHFAFDTTQKAAVDLVKISLQKDTALLVKIGGQWVAALDSFPVDTAKINKGLGYLLGLQTGEVVSTNPSRLVEYGLDTAQAKHLQWRIDGKTYEAVLGKTSGIDYGTTYWKWEDKPEVYSTPGNFTWDLGTRPGDWKDHSLFKLETKDIKTLTVDWRDSTDALHHYKLDIVSDTTIRMVEPESSSVVMRIAAPILSQCPQFTIDEFITPGDTDLPKARLDTPMVVIKMDLKDGKSYELKAGRTIAPWTYVRHPFRKDAIKLSSWRFDAFKKTPDQISGRDTIKIAGPAAPRPSATLRVRKKLAK